MAKRRKLETPTAETLSQLEDEFRRETGARSPLSAPIAQVAADSVQSADLRSSEERARAARDRADAGRLRDAEEAGRLILEVPLEDINPIAMIRDRMVIDAEDLEELGRSILKHGLRMPIELYELPNPGDGPRYGLLSGYRRYRATENLREMFRGETHTTIPAVIRDPEVLGGTFVAMVEENEVRAELSHFERGRISVLSAQQGAFVNVEAAVEALFASASRAKRSKVRSFALIFEELGDMLQFPDMLREKEGLRLATALRSGGEERLRTALEGVRVESAEEERLLLDTVLTELEATRENTPRVGRPPRTSAGRTRVTDTDISIAIEREGQDWILRMTGDRLSYDVMRTLADEVKRLMSSPKR
ncbi:ParB/RepB/Spo0J family partition protein [Maritimibacter sp. DP1N21-5]|uniref:ParB/RepB/Spo0J family partition protein n=1 Tax=Maritimibacter sp. DP1N21-5 TaxID=2836867 RepID=UPI001C4666D9|nr:ParB/RepB/Spo0J family partition protein [Maritimibacter sp. DP1N21-5]MBV7407349.1 ParB/RepB/Spo0J family partition protein [Maritimibacter sp. DP1N21-5]